MSSTSSPLRQPLIDPRGPRFGALITSILLALALVLYGSAPTASVVLLGVQTLAFAAGSLVGPRAQPWGWVFKTFVRPRLAPPAELEDPRPPRFAQTVGLGFALLALVGVALSVAPLFHVAVGFALVAALLNAVFDFCLGCELYLLGRRVLTRSSVTGA